VFDDADEMARGFLRLSELLLVRLATLSGGTAVEEVDKVLRELAMLDDAS
jgi:hypothetical protein